MNRRILVAVALVLSVSISICGQGTSLAWKRWQHLQHGVALSGWFSESGNYSIQQLRSFTTPADLEHIQKLGFDHVRIPVDPVIFQCEGDWNACERIQFLDQVIDQSLSRGLFVILDFHPNPQYTHAILTNNEASNKYLRLWGQVASHFNSIDQDRIVLEVMNEISVPDINAWQGLLERSIQVIRLRAPNSTIIVQGTNYSDIWDLVQLPPIADANLIYSFHYYEPHIFTHQGATWGLDYWLDIRHLPFPPTDKGVKDAMENTSSEEAKWRILQYQEDHWSADRIAGDIAFVAEWAHERRVPLICDEFGAYRNFTNPEDRERWITGVRSAFEKNGVGWTAWDYQGGFGVVYKEGGALRDDDVALRGLGLKK